MKPAQAIAHGGNGQHRAGVSLDPMIHNVQEIVRLQQRDHATMTRGDRVAQGITAFSGSMLFVYLHVIWFGAWIILNQGWFGLPVFDPYPFSLLTMSVSLEAIFLSTFVLISQNRQALQADRRQKVNLQIDILAEQEVTKLMHMVAEIQEHLGIGRAHDPELRELVRPTHIERLADAIDEAEREVAPKGVAMPPGTTDTEQ
jgi:uncharacterized membrane protein